MASLKDALEMLTGNGSPEKGLVFRTVHLEEKVLSMEDTIESLNTTTLENNVLLKSIAKSESKPKKAVFGISPEMLNKGWMLLIRAGILVVLGKEGFSLLGG